MLAFELKRPSEALPPAEEAYKLATDAGYAGLAEQIKGILDNIRGEES